MYRRLKVLVSAYACSPRQGSEPGVGWGFVSTLARRHDLWVIVEEEKFRGDIEQVLAENPELGRAVRFFFIRKQRNRWMRKFWPPSYYWYYRRWHQDAYRLAHVLQRQVGFDLVHQLNMVGFREPGYLWKLGIPFVWGPVGGVGLFPWRFLPTVGWYGAIYYLGYNLFNLLQMRNLSRPRLAARTAGRGLIAATPENCVGVLKYWGCNSKVVCEVGLPKVKEREIRKRTACEPLRIVWAGLHIPRKALNLGIEALCRLPGATDWELHILGEGSRTAKWKRLVMRRGIAERCYFHGWLPREQVLTIMGQAHIMLITSLRDLTSTVTIEALEIGMPIVCLDHCGFAEVVDDTCGIKIPVSTPIRVAEGISKAIEDLWRDEGHRQALANGALERAKEFTWGKKADEVNRIYHEVIRQANENLHSS